MATEETLRRQIHDLERQIQTLSQQQEAHRREIERKNNDRLRQLERELKQTIANDRREMDAAYSQRVHALQERLTAEMMRQVEEIRRADAAAQAERQALVSRLEQANEELRRQLEEMMKKERIREETGKKGAEEKAARADQQAKTVDRMPHAFFRPGELDILREQLQSAKNMIQAGHYDAALATADSSLAALEILEIDVREDQRKWEEIFEEYRRLVSLLTETVARFEREPVQTIYGGFPLSDKARDHWSGGAYGAVRREVQSANTLVEGVRKAGGAGPFLSAGGGIREFQMKQQITGLHRLTERLTAAIACVTQERMYSDERFYMAEKAEQVMEDQGHETIRSGFRGSPREDPLDAYDLVMTLNNEDTVTISFLPRREHGVAVGNTCIVTLDVRTFPEPELIKSMGDFIVRSLKTALPGLQAMWFTSGDRQIEITETEIKKQPDPKQLARKLERKYAQ